MATVNLPNTSKTSSDANNFSDVYANDTAITAQVNGSLDTTNLSASAAITGTQLASGAALANLASASVTDTKLASPNNSVYKTIATGGGEATNASINSAVTYIMPGGAITPSATGMNTAPSPSGLFWFDTADYTVAGLTQKLRLRGQVLTNATAPAITLTLGLYPISSVAGGANTITPTLGTVVSGSTVAFASPSASTISQNNSGDFTVPSTALYCLGVAASATLPANSTVLLLAQLQTRNV